MRAVRKAAQRVHDLEQLRAVLARERSADRRECDPHVPRAAAGALSAAVPRVPHRALGRSSIRFSDMTLRLASRGVPPGNAIALGFNPTALRERKRQPSGVTGTPG
jgi:hypothetical protein